VTEQQATERAGLVGQLSAAQEEVLTAEDRARKAEERAQIAESSSNATKGGGVVHLASHQFTQGSPFDSPQGPESDVAASSAAAQALQEEVDQLRQDAAHHEQHLQSTRASLQVEQEEVARLLQELSQGDELLQAEGELVAHWRKQSGEAAEALSALQAKSAQLEQALQVAGQREETAKAALAKLQADLQYQQQQQQIAPQENHLTTPTKAFGVAGAGGGGRFISPIAGPSTGTSRTLEAAALLESTPRQQREIALLTAQVARERRGLGQLQEAHNDLLALLAQEEVELNVYRDVLGERVGEAAVEEAHARAQTAVTERYGAYVNLREPDDLAEW